MVRQRSAKPLFTSSNLVAASTYFCKPLHRSPVRALSMKFIADFHVHSKFSRATAINQEYVATLFSAFPFLYSFCNVAIRRLIWQEKIKNQDMPSLHLHWQGDFLRNQ